MTKPQIRHASPQTLVDDMNSLHDSVQRLRTLLDLQRHQLSGMEMHFYGPGPAGTAAWRLQTLKFAERERSDKDAV